MPCRLQELDDDFDGLRRGLGLTAASTSLPSSRRDSLALMHATCTAMRAPRSAIFEALVLHSYIDGADPKTKNGEHLARLLDMSRTRRVFDDDIASCADYDEGSAEEVMGTRRMANVAGKRDPDALSQPLLTTPDTEHLKALEFDDPFSGAPAKRLATSGSGPGVVPDRFLARLAQGGKSLGGPKSQDDSLEYGTLDAEDNSKSEDESPATIIGTWPSQQANPEPEAKASEHTTSGEKFDLYRELLEATRKIEGVDIALLKTINSGMTEPVGGQPVAFSDKSVRSRPSHGMDHKPAPRYDPLQKPEVQTRRNSWTLHGNTAFASDAKKGYASKGHAEEFYGEEGHTSESESSTGENDPDPLRDMLLDTSVWQAEPDCLVAFPNRVARIFERCTYREVSAILLRCRPIATALLNVVALFPQHLQIDLGDVLGNVIKQYFTRLESTVTTRMENRVLIALQYALPRHESLRYTHIVRLVSHLPASLHARMRAGRCTDDELITAIDQIPDGDYHARRIDGAWMRGLSDSRVQDFLFRGGPFIGLRQDLEDICRPKLIHDHLLLAAFLRKHQIPLRIEPSDLIQVATDLARVPSTSIKIAFAELRSAQQTSWLSRLQLMVEDSTGAKWDWWPLPEATDALKARECRISWICECGLERSVVVPYWFGRIIFLMMYGHGPMPNKKKIEFLLRGSTKQDSLPTKELNGTEAQNQSTTVDVSTTPDLERGDHTTAAPTLGPDIGNNAPDASPSASTSGTLIGPGTIAQATLGHWVFFSTKVGHEFCLSQIAVGNVCDDSFFKAIKREYLSKKGWIRRLFSIWRFGYCDFSMFEKIGDKEYVARPEGNSLPPDGHKDYEFKPRPADTMPPISQHEFWRRFYLRRRNIRWRGPKSDMCCTTAHALQKIPKRDNKVIEDSDDRDLFWGLLAIDKISFLSVLLYLALLPVGAIGFWIYWLSGHPGDLQNASVPFFASVGCLSLMWIFAIQR